MAIDENKLALCRKFYIEHYGCHHAEIGRLMRDAGYTTFSTRCLYRSGGKPGYIERFNWKEEVEQLRSAECGLRSEPGAAATGFRKPQDTEPTGNKARKTPQPGFRSPHFQSWLKRVSPQYTWHWKYQQYIYERLEKVTSGECKRLMIFMPPRHGKSELVTVRYAAWRLQQDPSLNIILGSYNQKLANKFSRKIRNVYSEADRLRNADCGVLNEEAGPARRSVPPASAGGRARENVPTSQNLATQPPAHAGGSAFRRANTAEEWELPQGGGVRAVGVGAGITGFGAKLVIIDDPVKSRAEAESKTYRDRLSDWFSDDIYTRLEPDAAIILIQTRWHEDDLAGRLLKDAEHGGEEWEVISLPALAEETVTELQSCRVAAAEETVTELQRCRVAELQEVSETTLQLRNFETSQPVETTLQLRNFETSQLAEKTSQLAETTLQLCNSETSQLAEKTSQLAETTSQLGDPLNRLPGEALCPERFNVNALERIKRQLGSYSFAALYQQRPAPVDGGLFKRSWFKVVDHAPKGLTWKRGYDLAVSINTSADYTASFRCALQNDILYIDGGFRKRIEFPEQKRYILDRMQKEPDTEHGIESALHGAAFVQEMRRMPGFLNRSFRAVRVEGDKFSRALAWANRAEEGKLRLVRGSWNDTFIDEAAAFPNSAHDDQIDAVSIAVEMLTRKKFIAMGF